MEYKITRGNKHQEDRILWCKTSGSWDGFEQVKFKSLLIAFGFLIINELKINFDKIALGKILENGKHHHFFFRDILEDLVVTCGQKFSDLDSGAETFRYIQNLVSELCKKYKI